MNNQNPENFNENQNNPYNTHKITPMQISKTINTDTIPNTKCIPATTFQISPPKAKTTV